MPDRAAPWRLLRRHVLLTVSLLIAACAAPPESRRPNVLLIVADDMGYNDLAANNGVTAVPTPNLDALARDGVRFTRHYADAVCSPARAALLAGMIPARLGFTPDARGLSPQLQTLPESLREAGYSTVHIGKWHIGDTVRDAWPDRQGFQRWFGFLNQWFLAGAHAGGRLVHDTPRHVDPWLMRDGDAGTRHSGFLDDILTEEAIRQVNDLGAADAPWFINLWYYLPHGPVTPAASFAARHPDTPAGRYEAMLENLDTNVGRLLQSLQDTEQARNTIVVFVSDNGAPASQQHSNAPFYGAKTTFHEGGVRTPLLIRWPDGAGAGRVDDELAAIYDIYPTLLARLGIAVPAGLDGLDLSAPRRAPRDLYWEMYGAGHYGYSLLHDGRWRLYKAWPWVSWDTPAQLFDLAGDPAAPANVTSQHAGLLERLERRRREMQRDLHRLPLQRLRAADGSAQLRGLDFLRTPGFGGFSFAIAIGEGYAGHIAGQSGTWSMRATDDGSVTVDIGGHLLGGRPGADAPCHTVLVSGWFSRRISTLPGARDHIELGLYLDGEKVDARAADARIDDSGFAAPTVLGAPGARNDLLGEALVLSSSIESSDSWNAAELHRELCARGAPQQGLQSM